MRLYAVITLVFLFCKTEADIVSQGTLRFLRNGIPDESQSWSSGIVEVYYSGSWGNICNDYFFNYNEADVVCHQLGYEGSSLNTNTGTKTIYGVDPAPTAMEDVSCSLSSYLAVTQCSFTATDSGSYCTDSDDTIVSCYTTRIWDSPFAGDIRLTGGIYSNQGLLEVYCNEEWGTVCDVTFSGTEATVTCKQLGYNNYNGYNHLSNQGSSSEKIWLNSLRDCSISESCLTSCQGCPLTEITSCSHDEDVTVQCSYDASKSSVDTDVYNYCDYTYKSGWTTSYLTAVIFLSIIGCFVVVTVPICICVCLRIGVGEAVKDTRTTTSTPRYPAGYQSVLQENDYAINHDYPPTKMH